MSGRAKGLIMRVLDRIIDGPPCPNCKHDVSIHWEDGHCLGAVMEHGKHVRWCTCLSPKKEKEDERTGSDSVLPAGAGGEGS